MRCILVAVGRSEIDYSLPNATLIKKDRNDLPLFSFETLEKNIFGLPAL
jgi:hypothetical protein